MTDGQYSEFLVLSNPPNPLCPALSGAFHATAGELGGYMLIRDEIQVVAVPRRIVIPTKDIPARVESWITNSVDLDRWRDHV